MLACARGWAKRRQTDEFKVDEFQAFDKDLGVNIRGQYIGFAVPPEAETEPTQTDSSCIARGSLGERPLDLPPLSKQRLETGREGVARERQLLAPPKYGLWVEPRWQCEIDKGDGAPEEIPVGVPSERPRSPRMP